MARRNPIEEALRQVLLEEGATEISLDVTRCHSVFYFVVAGVKCMYFFPKTPTCPRSLPNNVAGVRRMIREAKTKASTSA